LGLTFDQTMPLTLYNVANNYQLYKVQIAAKLAGVELDVKEVKTVHDKTPHNKGPVLDTGKGTVFGSNTIMRYLARSTKTTAYGTSLVASAEVDQWVDYCLLNLEPARGVWLFPVLEMMPLNHKAYAAAKKDVTKALNSFDKHLLTNTYFVGHYPTLADVAIFAAFVDLFSTVLAPSFTKRHVNFMRWFKTVAHHPAFASVVGEIQYCKQEKRAKAPPKQQQQQKNNKGGNQQKKQQPKQQQKKAPKPKKPKNPLDLLPPSKMIMDVTKKAFFSKRPFNPEFFDTFWDNYDAEGYCFYTMHYNYNDENKVFWMTQNQVGMLVQRLDPSRKYAFGALMLLGENEETGPWSCEGLFLFRGSGIPAEFTAVDDTAYYTMAKLDTTKPENRALIQEYLQGDKVHGLNCLDRRYFK